MQTTKSRLVIVIAITFSLVISVQHADDSLVWCPQMCRDCDCCSEYNYSATITLPVSMNCSSPGNSYIEKPHSAGVNTNFMIRHAYTCLAEVPNNICSFTNLVFVFMGNNQIQELPSMSCLENLIVLDFSYNKIEVIRGDIFHGLKKLRIIRLDNNRIHTIEVGAFFSSLVGLKVVRLSHNKLTSAEASWPMSIRHPFCYFDLSYNMFTKFTNQENWTVNLLETYGPGMVDFSHNNFTTWVTKDLEMYGITDLRSLGKFMLWGFDFRGNPWSCDCKLYKFLSLASNLPQVIWRKYFNVKCYDPPQFRGKKIVSLKLEWLVCNVTEACPSVCLCQDQPGFSQMEVDCQGGGLTELPRHLPPGNLKLLFRNNSIRSLDPRDYLNRVVAIDLSENGLLTVTPEAIDLLSKSKAIDLSENKIQYLPKNIQNIPMSAWKLKGNDFQCSCNVTWMSVWLDQNAQDYNLSDIVCFLENGEPVPAKKANDNFLDCIQNNPVPRILAAVLGTAAVLFVVLIAVLIVFRYEAMVITNQYIAKVKYSKKNRDEATLMYDFYVSLNAEDDTDRIWVGKTLLPQLEDKGCQVYVPFRDSLPGSVAVDEAIKMMQKSRAVLVCVSDSYIHDPSKMFEFSEAYNIMARKGQGNLVLIRYCDVKPSSVDENGYLKALLRLKKFIDASDVDLIDKVVFHTGKNMD